MHLDGLVEKRCYEIGKDEQVCYKTRSVAKRKIYISRKSPTRKDHCQAPSRLATYAPTI